MRIFNETKGKKYEELIKPYETYLPVYFEKLGIAHETYPQLWKMRSTDCT